MWIYVVNLNTIIETLILKKKQLISYNLNSIVDKDKINKNMESSLLCSQNNMTACVELLAAKNAL